MIRGIRAFSVGVGLLATVIGGSVNHASASAADTWLAFTDPDSNFTVQVPGTPTVSRDDTTKDADGTLIPTVSYQVDLASMTVNISVTDFGHPTTEAGGAIDGAVAGLKAIAKQVVVDQISVLDGQVGREFIYIDKDGNRVDDRIYFANQHLFQALAVIAKDSAADQLADCSRFLSSFQLTIK